MSIPDISVILPCYNGREYIERSLNMLIAYLEEEKAKLGDFEIIVVDDGSLDGTAEIVSETFPGVTLIRIRPNRGKGAAVRTGMLAATGRYRFFLDADIPFDLRLLEKMRYYLDFKEFDLCIGTRPAKDAMQSVRQSFLRRLSSFLFTFTVSRLVVTGIRDTQCGMKGFRGEIAEYLFSQSRIDGFAFDVEILYLAFKNDMDFKRIRVSLIRSEGSTVSVFRHGVQMLLQCFTIPWRYYAGIYKILPSRYDESEDA